MSARVLAKWRVAVALLVLAILRPTRAKRCACFSFCHPEEIQHFLAQLPVVQTESSAWYPYLRAVYGGDVPLPIDLREFGTFRFPRANVGLLANATPPLARACSRQTLRSTVPSCGDAECSRWLTMRPTALARAHGEQTGSDADNRPANLRAAGATRRTPVRASSCTGGHCLSLRWSAINESLALASIQPSTNATGRLRKEGEHKYRFERGHVVEGPVPDLINKRWIDVMRLQPIDSYGRESAPLLLRVKGEMGGLRERSWVEVVRFETRMPEGFVYGCWSWPLAGNLSRGSGVFVNTGRMLTVRSKFAHETACKARGFKRYTGVPPELGPVPAWLQLNLTREGPKATSLYTDLLGKQSDNFVAACAQRLGYDSLWLVRDRMFVLTTPECTLPGSRDKIGACLPASLETRTGWYADRACACADYLPPGGRRAGPPTNAVFMNCDAPSLQPQPG